MPSLKKTALGLVIMFVLLISLVVALQSVKSSSQTITVPDDFTTIQAAVDNASAGDTVFVKNGTYYCGLGNEIVINKSLSLIGEDANTTIINGQYETFQYHLGGPGGLSTVSIDASNVLITGFTITNCENAIAINQYSNSYTVSGIHIIGNNLIGNFVGIRDADNSLDNNLLVSGNNIANNSLVGFYLDSANSLVSNNLFSDNNGAIGLNEAENVTVCYNRIVNNSRGVSLAEVSGASIFGNNITGSAGYYSPDDYGYGISFTSNCNNSLVYDNNIWGNTYGIILRNVGLESSGIPIPQGSGNVVYHNNLFDNSQNANVEHQYPNNVNGVVNGTTIVSWDTGTVGNYWGDYLSRYPNATEMGTSGIGDTPYIIDENNTDQYPYVQKADISTTPSPHSTLLALSDLQWAVIVAVVVVIILVLSFLFYRNRTK